MGNRELPPTITQMSVPMALKTFVSPSKLKGELKKFILYMPYCIEFGKVTIDLERKEVKAAYPFPEREYNQYLKKLYNLEELMKVWGLLEKLTKHIYTFFATKEGWCKKPETFYDSTIYRVPFLAEGLTLGGSLALSEALGLDETLELRIKVTSFASEEDLKKAVYMLLTFINEDKVRKISNAEVLELVHRSRISVHKLEDPLPSDDELRKKYGEACRKACRDCSEEAINKGVEYSVCRAKERKKVYNELVKQGVIRPDLLPLKPLDEVKRYIYALVNNEQPKICDVCGKEHYRRSKYCSDACKQKAYRIRQLGGEV